MAIEFWHNIWNEQRIGFHRDAVHVDLIQYFDQLNCRAGDRILVPLCGKTLDMVWLAHQGLEVIGIELSAVAITAFFQEHDLAYECEQLSADVSVYTAPQITIYCANIFKLDDALIKPCDTCFDRAALIALPYNIRQRYIDHIANFLKPEAALLLIGMHYPHQVEGPPYSVTLSEIKSLFQSQFDYELLQEQHEENMPEHLQARGILDSYSYVVLAHKRANPNA